MPSTEKRKNQLFNHMENGGGREDSLFSLEILFTLTEARMSTGPVYKDHNDLPNGVTRGGECLRALLSLEGYALWSPELEINSLFCLTAILAISHLS